MTLSLQGSEGGCRPRALQLRLDAGEGMGFSAVQDLTVSVATADERMVAHSQ